MQIEKASRPRAPSRAAIYRQFQAAARCPKPKAMSYAQLTGRDVTMRATRDDLDLLNWIADNADSLIVDGEHFAIVRLPAHMADKLAAIGAALADLEPEHDREPDEEGGGGHNEWTPDAPNQSMGAEDSDYSIPERLKQDTRFRHGGELGGSCEDYEDGHDREGGADDDLGVEDERRLHDDADFGELDEEGGDDPGCPPHLVERLRADLPDSGVACGPAAWAVEDLTRRGRATENTAKAVRRAQAGQVRAGVRIVDFDALGARYVSGGNLRPVRLS